MIKNDTAIIEEISIKLDKKISIHAKKISIIDNSPSSTPFKPLDSLYSHLISSISVDSFSLKTPSLTLEAKGITYIPSHQLSTHQLIIHRLSSQDTSSSSLPTLAILQTYAQSVNIHSLTYMQPKLSLKGEDFSLHLSSHSQLSFDNLSIHDLLPSNPKALPSVVTLLDTFMKNHSFHCSSIGYYSPLFSQKFSLTLNSTLTLNSSLGSLSFSLTPHTNHVTLSSFSLHEIKNDISYQGEALIFYKPLMLTTQGILSSHDFTTHFKLNSTHKEGKFSFNNGRINSHKLAKRLILPPNIRMWLNEKISLTEIHLDSFNGSFNPSSLTLNTSSLQAKAHTSFLALSFDSNLAPLTLEQPSLSLRNNHLTVTAPVLHYKAITSNPLQLSIDNLFSNPFITLSTSLNHPFDDTVHEIVKNYTSVQLPHQTQGTLFTSLQLAFIPSTSWIDYNISIQPQNGVFHSSQPFKLTQGSLHITPEQIQTHNLFFEISPYAKGTLQGEYNRLSHDAHGDIFWHDIHLKVDPLTLFSTHYLRTPFSFKNNRLSLPTLGLDMNTSHLYDNNLSLIEPFSPLLQHLNIKDGTVTISHDVNTTTLQGNALLNKPLLYDLNGSPLSSVDFSITADSHSHIYASLLNDNIELTSKDITHITAKNIGLGLDFNASNKDSSLPSPAKPLELIGKNLALFLNKHLIKIDSLSLYHDANNSHGELTYQQGKAIFWRKNNSFEVNATNFDSSFYDAFSIYDVVAGGKFNFFAKGTFDNFEGSFELSHTTLLGMAGFNNIVAFVNLAPSLFTLSNPGFNTQGYFIQNARVKFHVKDGVLYLDSITIEGNHTDVHAHGFVNLNSRNIQLELKIFTIKSLGKIISSLPLAGHLILGKDKNFTISAKVDGTLEKPELTTYTTEGILLSPFHILKRIIRYPVDVWKD